MENKNQPASPWNPPQPWNDESASGYSGLTKREEFAKAAMEGLITANSDLTPGQVMQFLGLDGLYDPTKHWPMYVAKWAVAHADELLKALEK